MLYKSGPLEVMIESERAKLFCFNVPLPFMNADNLYAI
jgi:hypothetical protein